MTADIKIDKSKFELVDDKDYLLDRYEFASKPSSFRRDAFIRFRKNKSSVVAFFIIAILLFLVVFGPFMVDQNFAREEPALNMWAFDYLPARVPVIEHLGFMNGQGVLIGLPMAQVNEIPSEFVVRVFNHRDVQGVLMADVRIHYYMYREYVLNNTVFPNMSAARVQQALERNALLEIVNFHESNNTYDVRIDIFQFAFGRPASEVYFWFGTDMGGLDLFTVLFTGARISLLLAIAIVVINTIIGISIGSLVGYYGGKLDIIFERLIDILVNIPFLTIITLLILHFGSQFWVVIVAFTATGWISSYSLTRIQTYRFKSREFVLAARTYGASDARIIWRHILPSALGFMITQFALAIPGFLLAEATWSFLGVIQYGEGRGVGQLLAEGQNLMPFHTHMLIFPAIFIGLMMISFNLFSNGLRDAFNPSLRGVED